ncbi:MAG: ABC transporter permease [Gemmatimonadaceae bacterium]|nr:ABC transporter permease [Gemmatimonadaceae bacterium]
MIRVVLSRLGQGATIVALVVSGCFALIRLAPGDPFAVSYVQENVTAEMRDRMRRIYGFDRPIAEQYVLFVRNVARGELGWSFSRGRPVAQVLAEAVPPTLLLMGTALLLGGVGGVAVGAWQGWRGDTRKTRIVGRVSLVILSMPEFVLALLLALGPALAWGLFPVTGMQSDFAPPGIAGVLDVLHHLVLPALTLALVVCAMVARHQRRAILAVTDADFVRAARAKGVPEHRILLRHALRNALVPVLTLAGVLFPALIGGAVLVERVFAWPGMGSVVVDAVVRRDYPLVGGSVLLSSLAVVMGTVLADIAVAWADPRRRQS